MANAAACPGLHDLQRLVLGQLSQAEMAPLEQHILTCRHCGEALTQLHADDTLVEAMRAEPEGTAEDSASYLLADLMGRLKQLGSAAAPLAERLDSQPAQATPDDSAADKALPEDWAGALTDAEATEEFLSFLGPPQDAGELGRLGGYRVLKVLGKGGMGLVLRAEDPRLKRAVALKVMRPELSARPDFSARFQREAQAAAAVKHDHIATVYQVGEDRGIAFLALELLEGESLATRLDRQGPLPPAEVLRVGREAALGLAAAHAKGLIHRDINPANLWLEGAPTSASEPGALATGGATTGGHVKLLDFGLAKLTGGDAQATQSGHVLGTPSYMAPEQARGEVVDGRADLFSLGCVLYRAATGTSPFKGGDSLRVLLSLANEQPPSAREVNPTVPVALSDLIDRLLAKEPADRPASARAVAEELAAIAQAKPERVGRGPRRHWAVAEALAGAAALVALSVVVIIRDRHGREVARMEVPEGGSVEIKDERKAAGPPAPKPGPHIEPVPLAKVQRGEPLFPGALVRQPATLPGVRSWTIETRIVRFAWECCAGAFRPDGKRLAVGSYDGVIHIWEPQTGRLVQLLVGAGYVQALAWSPDGRVLAAGSHGGTVRLWDAGTGRLLKLLANSNWPQGFQVLHWSPDGRTVLAVNINTPHSLAWDAATGKQIRQIVLSRQPPYWTTAFSPDGKRIAGVPREGDEGLVIWDAATRRVERELRAPKGQLLRGVSWSPDGKRVAAAGNDGVRVWEVATGRETLHKKDAGAGGGLAWSPDGRAWIVYGGIPGRDTRFIVSVAEGATLQLPAGGVWSWSPDGNRLVGVGETVDLHEAAMGKRLRRLSGSSGEDVWGDGWSGDGQNLVWRQASRTFLASADTGQVFGVLKTGATNCSLWSPDGKRLATHGPDNTLLLWNNRGQLQFTLKGHKGEVSSLAWSPDGKRLASAARGETRVLLRDAPKGEVLRELGPFAGEAVTLSWSRDGRLLAFEVVDAGWHFWDMEQHRLVNDPKEWKCARSHNVLGLILAPDARAALVRPHASDTFRLRDLSTGKEGVRLPAGCTPRQWSPDGRLLVVTGPAGVELWRGDLRHRIRNLPSWWGGGWQFWFSPDSKLVLGVAEQRRFHLWEADTGRLRGIILPGEAFNGLTISPEGYYTGNEDVERGIVMVVQKEDGTQEVLEPADFEEKYGFKNDPDKVHLLRPLPPSPAVPAGQPLGPYALVREPAELPDANATSWTIETRTARGEVRAQAYRPDGKLLATGGEDGTIRLWDPANGRLVRMLVGEPVNSLSWSKDGKVLAAGGRNGPGLWEAATGRLLHRLDQWWPYVAWSPNGQTLAVAGGGGTGLGLWNSATLRQSIHDFKTPCHCSAWSPDGKTIAFGFHDKTVRLWDVASGKVKRTLEGHETEVHAVAWSPDGKRLVSVAHVPGKTALRVWDTATGKLQKRFVADPQIGSWQGVAWAPDGTALITTIGRLDANTGRRIASIDPWLSSVHLALSPDGKQVAMVGGGLRLHNAVTGKRTHTLQENVDLTPMRCLAWSPDGQRLTFCNQGPYIKVVEAATGRRCKAPNAVYTASWSPDGKTFAAVGEGNKVCLWDVATGDLLRTMEDKPDGPLTQLAWSPDSKRLAGAREQHIWVWSAETGKRVWHNDKLGHVFAVAWSPDGRRLGSTDDSSDKGAVRIWDAASGKLLVEKPFRPPVCKRDLAWSPDGKTLAVCDDDALLLDATSGEVRARLHGDLPCWASDGKTLLTIRNWGLCEWNPATGEQRRAMIPLWRPAHGGHRPAAWSPEGRVLARNNGRELSLFDSNGFLLGVLLPNDAFQQLTITPEGHYRGTARVEREIRMVVQKRDGSSETLTPAEFESRYGWRNDPAKVRLLK
jgi:WD40 repeat protein/serine/threonine protein kinase